MSAMAFGKPDPAWLFPGREVGESDIDEPLRQKVEATVGPYLPP
jgi:hypothetical protein